MLGGALLFCGFLFLILLDILLTGLIFPQPISDVGAVRHHSIPIVTILLILVNMIVFIFFQAPNPNIFVAGDRATLLKMDYDHILQYYLYGYRYIFVHQGVGIGALSAFTSMFMHADVDHILFNMIALWTFGRRVEDACGAWRFLLFYLLAGMIANIGSDILNTAHNDVPSLGASGAIAGVMGAYLILFPGTLIRCFWGIGIVLRVPAVLILKIVHPSPSLQKAPLWRWTIDIPAWTFLIFWLVLQVIPSFQVIERTSELSGVNTLAHMTGFLAALLIFLFARKDMVTRYFSGRSV